MNDTATSSTPPTPPAPPPLMPELPKTRGPLIAFGIISILLGTAMILTAAFVSVISMIFLGAMLIAAGAIELTQLFAAKHPHSVWRFLIGVLYIVAGACMVINPEPAAVWFTLVIAFMFLFGGAVRIGMGFSASGEERIFQLFGGFLGVILGILIWRQWPFDLWVIGMLIGIDVLYTGWLSIATAAALKRAGKADA